MFSSRRLRGLIPFFITVGAVLFVGLFKVGLARWLHYESPLLLFFSAVTISAWFGGAGQGLLATVLSLIFAHYVFISGATEAWPADVYLFRVSLFVIDCLFITGLCAALRRTQVKAQRLLGESQKAIKASMRSEDRFRHVFDSNMIGLLFSEWDGRIVEANDYFLQMLGYSRADLEAGRLNWVKITPPEHLEISLASLKRVQDVGLVAPFEKEYVRADGSRVFVLVGAATLDDRTSVAFILDISERKRVESALANAYGQLEERVVQRTQELILANNELKRLVEKSERASDALRQSQSFLDSVVENLPNMIFVKEAENLSFVRFNKAGENLLGVPREDLIGKNDYDFFPKDQADFFVEKDRAVLSGCQVVDIPEEPLNTRYGTKFLHTKKIPILNKEGRPQYLLGISEDITEKKAAEQQRLTLIQEQVARAEAEKTAARLSFLSEASATLSESLDINTMLSAFAQVVISEVSDWCAIDLVADQENRIEYSVVAHRDPDKVAYSREWRRKYPINWEDDRGFAHVLRTGEPEIYPEISEEMLRQAAKSPEHLEDIQRLGIKSMMFVPLKYYGRIIGVLQLVSAESERHYSNFDLSLAQDLARRASFAIENARLFSKAQEASRAKSAFLANMSHEIRTPLGAMIGFAELMLDHKNLSAEQMDSIMTIVRNGRQLLRIVDEILDLSKVESEKIQIERLPFSLHKLVDEVSSLLTLRAREKSLQLNVVYEESVPDQVISDPTRLRQILINVIGNAIKFTDHGSVELRVQMAPHASANKDLRLLQFAVTDTGIGISEEQRRRLFQPFVQADNSTTRRFGGTGLGLFLSRKLARLLGGDLALHSSQFGQGSQFLVTVEVQLGKDAIKGSVAESRFTAGQGPTPSQGKGRVLVVDDSPDNRVLIGYYLSRMGLDSDMAENGRQGIEKAMHGAFDVILMDLQMPDVDGFEAVRTLRERGYGRPIIALTAHAMRGDRERCLQSGFDDYLGKPIDREALRKSLQKHGSLRTQ